MSIVLRSGAPNTPTYPLISDTFNTADAAPVTSPRNAEPGPGQLINIDTESLLSISTDNALVCAGGRTTPDWGDPGAYFISTGALGRGCYMQFDIEVTSGSNIGFAAGWGTSTTLALANLKHCLIGSAAGKTLARPSGELSSAAGAGLDWPMHTFDSSNLVVYSVRIYALRTGGGLALIKGGQFSSTNWHALYYSKTGTDSPLYPTIFWYAAPLEITNVSVKRYRKPPMVYPAYYNGAQPGLDQYAIGRAISYDGRNLGRWMGNPVLQRNTTGDWDGSWIKDPCVVRDGDTYKMWYAGRSTGTSLYQIGLATSTDGITWTKSTANPVITLGSTGEPDSGGCTMPNIWKDSTAVGSTTLWRMLYAGTSSGGSVYGVCYAYSSDGITWTKSSANPVIGPGTSSEWNSVGTGVGAVHKDGNTFYVYAEGRSLTSFPIDSQVGLWTCTDLAGPFSASTSNPIIARRTGSQDLTALTATGGGIAQVADTADFAVGEAVAIANTSNVQQNRIRVIESSNGYLYLETPAMFSFSTADGSAINSQYRSVSPSFVTQEAGIWRMWITPYQWGLDATKGETVGYAESTAPDAGWAIDHSEAQPFLLAMSGQQNTTSQPWDGRSAENVRFVVDADTKARVKIPA